MNKQVRQVNRNDLLTLDKYSVNRKKIRKNLI